MKHFWIIFFSLFLIPICSDAQVVTTKVSSKEVVIGNQIQVEFSAKSEVSSFNAPDFENFRVLVGPQKSLTSIYSNGIFSQTTSFTYTIIPLKSGSQVIKPATFIIKGKKYFTNSVQIQVLNIQTQTHDAPVKNIPGDNSKTVFVRAEVSNPNPYNGDQILVKYNLYYSTDIYNPSIEKIPKFNGFWFENIDIPRDVNALAVTINGKQYQYATIYKSILFPQKTGELTIEPLILHYSRRVKIKNSQPSVFDYFFPNSIFEDESSYQTISESISSNSLKINVKKFPEPIDSGFSGLVGDFNLTCKIDKPRCKVNEAITLTVTLTGTGNLMFFEPPELQIPDEFEAYSPKPTEYFSTSSNKFSGSKQYDYILIPKNSGSYTIPLVSIVFFNPQIRKFITLNTQNLVIEVAKNTGYTGSSKYYNGQESTETNSNEINPIETKIPLITRFDAFKYKNQVLIILLIIPVSGSFLLFWFFKKREKLILDTVRYRKTNAYKNAMTEHKKTISEIQTSFNYEKILTRYLSEKMNIPESMLTVEMIINKLRSNGISDPLLMQIEQFYAQSNMNKFAPVNGELNQNSNSDQLKIILTQLESSLK